jgi:trimeric autotransporter adhesin
MESIGIGCRKYMPWLYKGRDARRSRSQKELFMRLVKCVVFSILSFVLSASIGFSQSNIITTYVGPGLPVIGELAVSQAIDYPTSIAPDGAGGFYVASQSQNRVYRVEADGRIRLAAGNGNAGFSGDGKPATSAQLYRPWSVATDGIGNLYIADTYNRRIRKVTPDGVINTVAGNGAYGYGGDGGSATAAQLGYPYGIAVDSSGNLYIADNGTNRIRKVTAAGMISTAVGSGTYGYGGDGGLATAAQMKAPTDVAVDSAGSLYIADYGNYRIRKVTRDGLINTVAGNGTSGSSGDNGPATAALISSPYGVAIDSAGNLYIADYGNNRIRKVTAAGVISTVAGNGFYGYGGDGSSATAAAMSYPYDVAVDSAGNLFIADYGNNRVRKVTAAGVINTAAGNGTKGFSGDGGPATAALINSSYGVAIDSAGNLYIADYGNSRVRKVTAAGIISTVAGNGTRGYGGDGGPAPAAQLNNPPGVAVDSAGNLYITDYGNHRVRKVTAAGVISTVAGNGTSGFSGDGGPATLAKLYYPTNIAVDSAGNLYIADYGNYRVRKVTAAGVISTVAGTGTAGFSGDGGLATAAQARPFGVAVDSKGNLYIADYTNYRIRKVTLDGMISTVAGNGSLSLDSSGDGGPATAASLLIPMGVSVDSENNLFISETYNSRIRKVTADGVIHTVAGNGMSGYSGDNGSATAAQLNNPYNVAIDSSGNLFIADSGNYRIRKVEFLNCPSSLSLSSGGAAACRTAGTGTEAKVGYAKLAVNSGAAPYATALFSFKQNGVTVAEAGVPTSPPTTQARIFIDYRAAVTAIPGRSNSGTIDINTGLAIVNNGSTTANVVYTLRDLKGATLAVGHGTIAAGNHIACFINQLKEKAASDFNLPSNFQSAIQFATLEIASNQSVSVVALRGTNNQRKEFLITTTPIADLTKPLAYSPTYFPQFADGGGYTTSLILMNTSDQDESGTLQILDNNGLPLVVTQVGGTTASSFSYSIPAGGAFHFQADGFPTNAKAGWVRLNPGYLRMTPIGSGIFSYNPNSILVSETGIPPAVPTMHARVYVDLSANHNTGLALANISSAGASITVNAFQKDGVSAVGTSQGTLALAGNGHDAKFVNQFIAGLPDGFRGVLDISSPTFFAALTVRSLINERDDFLMTTFPIADANQDAPSPIVFPQVSDGGGYITEFILIGAGKDASIAPSFYDETGAPANFSN